MNIFLSLLFLVGLAGVIAWIKSRGYFQHIGCTCRDQDTEESGSK